MPELGRHKLILHVDTKPGGDASRPLSPLTRHRPHHQLDRPWEMIATFHRCVSDPQRSKNRIQHRYDLNFTQEGGEVSLSCHPPVLATLLKADFPIPGNLHSSSNPQLVGHCREMRALESNAGGLLKCAPILAAEIPPIRPLPFVRANLLHGEKCLLSDIVCLLPPCIHSIPGSK